LEFRVCRFFRQPAPAGAELADAGGGVGLDLEPAEVLVDLRFQTTGQLAAPPFGFIQFRNADGCSATGVVDTAGFLPTEALTISSRDLPSNSVPSRVVSVGHVTW
jgi:hypothetical protein